MKYQTKVESLLKLKFQCLAPIAAMVCCTLFFSARAQETIYSGNFKTDTSITYPIITSYMPEWNGNDGKVYPNDTVRVIMLICDTLNKSTTPYEVAYRFGYSVRQKECCINGNISNLAYYQPVPYYTHLFYLDDKKERLKSSWIVWQSVAIK